MKTRTRLGMVAIAVAAAAGAARCASYTPIAVTSNAAAVSSCQKVADVALRNDRSYDDPEKSLIEETRAKGANTLLYSPQGDGAKERGVAYQCSVPAAVEKSQP